jgi:hypothetical protein
MEWFAEENPVMGGIKGQGIATLLRTGKLDNISVLVRETIQNSWDARLSDRETVKVSFTGRSLSGARLVSLRELMATKSMPVGITELSNSFSNTELNVLIIRDENCEGLGGPVRADDVDVELGGKNRYASFLLNVGASEHSEGDGGQFGYGRSIAYRVSKPLAIVVYSRTMNEAGKPESRLIGSMLSNGFKMKEKSYTGRHWWGEINLSGGGCAPLVGPHADQLAINAGFEQYEKEQFGTSIMIIDPTFGEEFEGALSYIADSIVWNMWPKMISSGGRKAPMAFEVWNGESEIKICDPRTTYPLSEFCAAYDSLKDATGGKSASAIGKPKLTGEVVQKVECLNPRFDIGYLSLRKFPTQLAGHIWSALDDEDGGDPRSSDPVGLSTHHVAIMRTPELIVDYLSFRESPDDTFSWVGVFRTTDEMDIHFKNSEPPTHDAWNKQALEKGVGKTAVGVGLERIKRLSSEYSDLLSPLVPPAAAGVTALAKSLSKGFMSSVEVPTRGGGGGGGGGGGLLGSKVDFILSAGKQTRAGDRDRKIAVNVLLAKSTRTIFSLNLSIIAAVAEGDSGSAVDEDVVGVEQVKNKDGKLLWKKKIGRPECNFDSTTTDFPLQVMVEASQDFAVSLEVTGKRIQL